MEIVTTIYLILTVVFFIDIILAVKVLEYVKQAINVRERPKLVNKISELRGMIKYTLVWPYILYKLIRENVD